MANTDDNRFYDDCFIVHPEEASFSNLFGLLFNSHLEQRRFIYSPKQKTLSFIRRWIFFLSVLGQKLLLRLERPLFFFGNVIETSINLLHWNGGIFRLVLNLMTGKLVWHHRSSANFRTIVSLSDPRVDLGNNIKTGDDRYKAFLCTMCSKFAFENEAYIKTNITEHWKMKFLKFYHFWNDFAEHFTTQAFMVQDTRSNPNLIVLAFRGTYPFATHDWVTDLGLSWYELKGMGNGKIHSGFLKALGLQKNKGWPKDIQQTTSQNQFAYYTLREDLRKVLLQNQEAKFILTGHSSGAAIAILFVAVLIFHEEEWLLEKLEAVFAFGQPRVGDPTFAEFMIGKLRKYDVKYYRFVYGNDFVARVPYDDKLFSYKHFGLCVFFNIFFKGKVYLETPMKNYYPVVLAIPRMIIAFLELIRSFILPYWKGPAYKETWVLRTGRVMGLVMPGISAHFPAEYVHCTRMGNFPSNLQLAEPHKHIFKRD